MFRFVLLNIFELRKHIKTLVLSIALGTLSLASGALRAQSSRSQTTQPSELTIAAKPDDAPDVPPANAVNPASPTPAGGMGPGLLTPPTFHDKFMAYAVSTVGPRTLFGPAFPAAIRMAAPPNDYPKGWRQGAEAFGRNYGDQLATASAFETGRFAAGAALHEDLRYHPSTSTNFCKRAGHAIGFTFVDRSDDGHARLAIANLAGLAAGGYVGRSYLPSGFNDVTHADQHLEVLFGRLVVSNMAAEFGADIFRFLEAHHLPRPRIPIPEWWVRR